MDFEIISSELAAIKTECLVIGIEADAQLTNAAKLIDEATQGQISAVINDGDHQGKASQCVMLRNLNGINAKRVLLVGLGAIEKRTDNVQVSAVKAIFSQLKASNITEVTIALENSLNKDADLYRQIRLSVQTACQGFYQYDETKSKKADAPTLTDIRFAVEEAQEIDAQAGLLDGTAVANGMSVARELGNLPGNICTPTYLGKEALELEKGFESINCEILDEAAMDELGMHSLLSVGNGSIEPSQLVVIKYNGGEQDQQPHVLVGKGVTFDTGGISLKPGASMDEMKFDMCGAASVMGTMHAIAEMELPINVIGVIAAAENMPSDRATKPGDVITTMSGKTVEVLNTDAEGRLVLCDALTYVERFNPKTVIDIATLTGAVIVALGHQASAVMSNNDALANELISAGEYAADRTWRLPIWDEYQDLLDSNFADIANIGGPSAGSITAACFLARFTEKYHWAHLDIAGIAWNKGKEKGASGRAVPILCQYLMNTAADLASEDDA